MCMWGGGAGCRVGITAKHVVVCCLQVQLSLISHLALLSPLPAPCVHRNTDVEQSDIHMPRTTVREALQISGLLRLHGTTRDIVEQFVDEVMGLVELESLRDSIVGSPGQFGLSVEQRKRLTIAVELVANPSIVFMDE